MIGKTTLKKNSKFVQSSSLKSFKIDVLNHFTLEINQGKLKFFKFYLTFMFCKLFLSSESLPKKILNNLQKTVK